MTEFRARPQVHHHTDDCYDETPGSFRRLVCPRPPLSWTPDAYEPGGAFYSDRRRPAEPEASGMVIVYAAAAVLIILMFVAVLALTASRSGQTTDPVDVSGTPSAAQSGAPRIGVAQRKERSMVPVRLTSGAGAVGGSSPSVEGGAP